MTANRDEWSIPQLGETVPATDNTPKVEFHHEGRQHQLPIVLWAISTDQLYSHQMAELIRSICHPDKLSIIVPMLDKKIPLGQRVMESYVQEIQDTNYITNPDHAGRTIERAYEIGGAHFLPVMIAVGDNLTEQHRDLAQAASDQIMTTIFREIQSHGSAGTTP